MCYFFVGPHTDVFLSCDSPRSGHHEMVPHVFCIRGNLVILDLTSSFDSLFPRYRIPVFYRLCHWICATLGSFFKSSSFLSHLATCCCRRGLWSVISPQGCEQSRVKHNSLELLMQYETFWTACNVTISTRNISHSWCIYVPFVVVLTCGPDYVE